MKRASAIIPIFAIAFGMMSVLSANSKAAQFNVCWGAFALCTAASCDPIPGHADKVSCRCTVNTGYSAGAEPCPATVETPEGPQITSRYYPVKTLLRCTNDRPWAMCLDAPCLVDSNNPQAAECKCDVLRHVGPYVIDTSTIGSRSPYTPTTCNTTEILSSATVDDVKQITHFLKSPGSLLTPFAIEFPGDKN